MPLAGRLKDLDSPHPQQVFPYPPHQDTVTTCSPNVTANNLGACRVGDKDSHPHIKTDGSPTVFVNNKAWHRVGDKDSGGNTLVTGSPNVLIN